MDVFLANEQAIPVKESRLTALARHVLNSEEVDDEAELSILVVDAAHMKQLNVRFADDDHATDVLAFPMLEDEEESMLLGDLVLCPEVADQNARRYGHSLDDELDILVVHGTLHLLGYDHQGRDDRARMEHRLKQVLDTFSEARA